MSNPFTKTSVVCLAVAVLPLGIAAASISPLPDKAQPVIPDRQECQVPDRVQLNGWIGSRIAVNESNRLVKLDPGRLLEGYRKRPGRQSWDGEHVGKWLHAATLAWANTGDPALRQRLDSTVTELLKCQLPDGYLGTYVEKDYWTSWDVWAHKYNLIGLITYMRYTGNLEPLGACRRIGDLLCATFGDEPGKRDILKAGYHVGMAPTSVLEPMVLLYRLTGETRYLDFCKYILRAWEQPNGPKIISTLLSAKRVDKVGNGKAYEMLSCLNGALEYYRTVGDPQIFQACLNAWQDIVDHRLYLTGAASYGEVFHDNFDLPNVAEVGETCVTVTWLQFNAQLLRLTGEARFAEQLEHVILNQLFGAQKCDGSAWGYYVELEGKKPYSSTLDGHCCLSSGPRGVSLIPTFALTTDADGVVVNLYDADAAHLTLRDGTAVEVKTDTRYPADGRIRISVEPAVTKAFALKLRLPAWCQKAVFKVNDRTVKGVSRQGGYAVINREWRQADRVELLLTLEPRVIAGDHKNAGKVAVIYGPLVLAADQALLVKADRPLSLIAAAGPDLRALAIKPEPAPERLRSWPSAEVFRMNAVLRRGNGTLPAGAHTRIHLVPFADAGATGTAYKVWLPLGLAPAGGNLLLDGLEARSGPGNVMGSINDDDLRSFVVTFNGGKAREAWFSVALERPATFTRIVFVHGKTFHDGGWFDVSAGKPRVEIQASADGAWEPAGELKDYPATTAADPAGLQGGEKFTLELAKPARGVAVRVIGKPACGDNPQQNFSSCAELQAW